MDGLIFDKRPDAADYANAHGLIVQETADGKYVCIEPPEVPEEPIDRTDFDAACTMFRAVCTDICTLLGVEDFRGGFDEMQAFQSSESFNTMPGLRLAIEWSAANELCKYEGAKIGLGQPQWWHECWKGGK